MVELFWSVQVVLKNTDEKHDYSRLFSLEKRQIKNDHDFLKMLLTQWLARMDDTNQLLVKTFNFSTENKEASEDKKPARNEQSPKQLVIPMNPCQSTAISKS